LASSRPWEVEREMSDEMQQGRASGWEWVLTRLVERDSGDRKPLDDTDEATLRDIEARLETLVEHLRQPPPADDFAEESGCRRAVELVEELAAQPQPPDRSPVPERIGPYEVVARLRRGGMGTVYKAIHPKLRRVVAIKVLPKFYARDAAAVARFEREMLALGGLSHRNIVAATDAGEADGMQYLVMEYVDGIDLSTLSRRVGPMAVADACEIVRQAAAGVAEAHRRDIVHRDIKPSNLILVESGERAGATVKVLDFGLARLAAECADDELTNSGQIMGTLKYMAPEQCASSREVDTRADVYSLGATLYRLLCGQAPFSGAKYDSPPALVAAIATEQPESLRTLRGELAAQLVSLVEHMMAKDPSQRISTPDEVSRLLAPFADGADLARLLARARTDDKSPIVPLQHVQPQLANRAAGDSAARQTRSPHPRFVWAAILLIAAAIGLYALSNVERSNTTRTVLPPTAKVARDPRIDPLRRSREIVEWMLSRQHFQAVVHVDGRGDFELGPGDDIPSEPFQLVSVDFDHDRLLRDKDLRHFDQLPQLHSMGLSETSVGDEGLRQLGYLPALENLFLVETNVTDEGIAQLRKYPRLRVLQLYGTDVTDEGLEHLAQGNPELVELSLVDCPVTDKGLATLAPLRQLKLLALDRTGVTVRGVAGLHLALPSCEIRSIFTADDIAAEVERHRRTQ